MNLLSELPVSVSDELTETLVQSSHVRIERIVSTGQVSPVGFWYDQDENEWVLVVQGAARLQFEDETIELKPGGWINIAAHRKHRVEWTSPNELTI